MNSIKFPKYLYLIFICFSACTSIPTIDREALVKRHNINLSKIDKAIIPQVGNGEIAFGIDITGLQTFYGNSMAQWGWHTAPLPKGKSEKDFEMTAVDVHNRKPTYPVSRKGQEEMYWWLRKNPHRLNLGRFSFLLDGIKIQKNQVSEIDQFLDMWEGVIYSNYIVEGEAVNVITTCHPNQDAIVVHVKSNLISNKRLTVELSFPYGNPDNVNGTDWNSAEKHTTDFKQIENELTFNRTLNHDNYIVKLKVSSAVGVSETQKHFYSIEPDSNLDSFSFTCLFTQNDKDELNDNFHIALEKSKNHWSDFWNYGGAIDLSESSDSRWKELERRIVQSQYLLAVNEAGSLPPQESGLLLNSGWYGKFHLEMHWWHGAHYELWDRWELFDKSLWWYNSILTIAEGIAERQAYEGARWPKMIGPNGRYAPSNIGPWLIWQQPHPIFYAEQNYRHSPTYETLKKWHNVVSETADFMADYAHFNSEKGVYELGPWVINAAENNHSTKHSTINPIFELAYWKYGLKVACDWNERLNLPINEKWINVLDNLAPLPTDEGVYVINDNVEDMWSRFNRSHIDVIGPGAFLPSYCADTAILKNTIEQVFNEWDIESTWGWDFPWLAMASARAGMPDRAIEALLMESRKNTYNKCGINQGGPAQVYFPGNGGLLYAVAMMAAGWDGDDGSHAPGFPKDAWIVKFEGLNKAQ